MSPTLSITPTTHPSLVRSLSTTATSGNASTCSTALTRNFAGIGMWGSTPNLARAATPQFNPASLLSAHFPAPENPPSYWADAKGNPCYPPAPGQPIVHARQAPELQIIPGRPLPVIGNVARRGVSEGLAGAAREQAGKHRTRITDQLHELRKVADQLRTAVPNLPAESIDFSPLANSLMDLHNAWGQGTLAGSSRFLKIRHPEANAMRTELEAGVKRATCALSGHIYGHAPRLAGEVMDIGQMALGIGSTRNVG
jgi:hypothetical protein